MDSLAACSELNAIRRSFTRVFAPVWPQNVLQQRKCFFTPLPHSSRSLNHRIKAGLIPLITEPFRSRRLAEKYHTVNVPRLFNSIPRRYSLGLYNKDLWSQHFHQINSTHRKISQKSRQFSCFHYCADDIIFYHRMAIMQGPFNLMKSKWPSTVSRTWSRTAWSDEDSIETVVFPSSSLKPTFLTQMHMCGGFILSKLTVKSNGEPGMRRAACCMSIQ